MCWSAQNNGMHDCINYQEKTASVISRDEREVLKLHNLILATKKIKLDEYPDAFNPSIYKTDFGYLMSFRYCPDRNHDAFSYVGLVRLNRDFDPISRPQLVETRFGNKDISPHAEDARIVKVNGKIYLVYNDSPHVFLPSIRDHRDMFVAEVIEEDGRYHLTIPIQLKHIIKYNIQYWQKNWVPFEWHNQFMLGYSIVPHEVVYADLSSGICIPGDASSMQHDWKRGELRGGTPAQLVDGEYLAFFHSSIVTTSSTTHEKPMPHYYMGAYTFSAEPPFKITKMSKTPIAGKNFYSYSKYNKRVIFPGGFVVDDEGIIHIAYGKNDREMWIASIDKEQLQASLVDVE